MGVTGRDLGVTGIDAHGDVGVTRIDAHGDVGVPGSVPNLPQPKIALKVITLAFVETHGHYNLKKTVSVPIHILSKKKFSPVVFYV